MKDALIFAAIISIIVGILDISLPEKIKPHAVPIVVVSFIVGLLIQRFIPTTFKAFTAPITAFITVFLASVMIS